MNRLTRYSVLLVSVLIIGWVGIGHVLGRTTDEGNAYKSLVVYSEVLQKIQNDYVDEPNMHLVTAGSLHGLLESLDSESSYLTPREYTEYQQKQGNPGTGETGLNLSKRFGYIIVTSVLPESPADKVGLHSGDILESVAGFTTREMSTGQAKNLMAGQPGTSVKVGVIRRGKTDPEELDLVRAKIPEPKLIVQQVDKDTLAIRFPTLGAGRKEEVKAKLLEAEKQGVTHVILDLRDCGRGSSTEAIEIAKLFVPSGTLTKLQGQTIPQQIFAARSEQDDLERFCFRFDGWNHDGRGRGAGSGDCKHKARRPGGRPNVWTGVRAEIDSAGRWRGHHPDGWELHERGWQVHPG